MKTTSHSERVRRENEKLMRKEKRKMTIHEFIINEILTLRQEVESLKAERHRLERDNKYLGTYCETLAVALDELQITDTGGHVMVGKGVLFDDEASKVKKALELLQKHKEAKDG